HDPNTIIGPRGPGDNGMVSPKLPLPYTILFTNQPGASAPGAAADTRAPSGLSPAQQVSVKMSLDPDLDSRTFRAGSFGFPGRSYTVPANSSFYQTTLDLVGDLGFDVDVTATVDVSTGVATWVFTTIDPSTGEIPADPTVGLLPPNLADGVGEGFVTFTVEA